VYSVLLTILSDTSECVTLTTVVHSVYNDEPLLSCIWNYTVRSVGCFLSDSCV